MRLRRRDFGVDPVSLARRLLSCRVVRVLGDGTRVAARIVETEAYLGAEDRAAHSFGGRRTGRVEAMYGKGGTAYVFFTYGMHYCLNVVCGGVGEPVAVLIRAGEVVEGEGAMRGLRGEGEAGVAVLKERDLCRGPARLCRAMGVDLGLNGVDLVTSGEIWVETERGAGEFEIEVTGRIGVEYAGEWAGRKLRFLVGGHRCVSGKSGKRRPRPPGKEGRRSGAPSDSVQGRKRKRPSKRQQ